MSGQAVPKHAVIDDFLPETDAQALLDHALSNYALFQPASVVDQGDYSTTSSHRQALATPDLGPARCTFTAAVEAHAEHLCKAAGLAPFPIAAWDVEMAAHRDGGFFHEHIDTLTAVNRRNGPGDRVISMVYYLHHAEARFSGGDLVIKPFLGDNGAVRIAPRHNRLVAFPSIARHEVEQISIPGDRWEDARFSINCWLLRAAA